MQTIEVNEFDFNEIDSLEDISKTQNRLNSFENAWKWNKAFVRSINRGGQHFDFDNMSYEDNWKLGKKFGKWVKKRAKAVGKGVKGVIKFVAGNTVMLPLQPFKGSMIKALNKKGVVATRNTSLPDVAARFYKYIVKGEAAPNKKQKFDFENYLEENGYSTNEDHIAPAAAAIVAGIIEFFKSSKAKKDNGEPLTKAEQAAAKTTEAVTSSIKEQAKTEAATQVGKQILFNPLVIVGVIAVIIVIILWKRK